MSTLKWFRVGERYTGSNGLELAFCFCLEDGERFL